MKTYTSPKTVVKASSKEGSGFFAANKINKGEIVAIKNGHIVNKKEAEKLDNELGDFSLQIDNEFFICPKSKHEIKNVVIYINHSCEPNIGMDGQINYVAMRDIDAGEELCLDYAMAMATDYELACKCGSENCRKIITGNDWKIKELQEKYGNYFAWFLLKKIKNSL